MAEVTRASTGFLLRTLFEILSTKPEGMQAREALAAVQSRVALSDYEKGNFPSGANRFEKILRFATVDAVKAGWFLKHKGIWSLTEKGKQAFRDNRDAEAFYREAVRLYHEWRKAQPEIVEEEDTPDEPGTEKAAVITFEAAEEQAWAEIEQYLRNMPPYEFQELVADLLRAMGYHVAWIADAGKDGGIDIVAYNDPLGSRLPRIKVQVKRHNAQKIDVNGLRSFMAVLGENDVGLFVSTSGFTRDAEDEARKQESRKVTLIDLEKFFDLWVAHSAKLDDAARRRFPLQPIYFLAPGN